MDNHPYRHHLPKNVGEGNIGGIKIRWLNSALDVKLDIEARRLEQPRELLKALTEHFVYLCARELRSTTADICGPPHDFSVDHTTGDRYFENAEHVTAKVQGGPPGRGKAHIYFRGSWDNVTVLGRSFRKGKTWSMRWLYVKPGWTLQQLGRQAHKNTDTLSKPASPASEPARSSTRPSAPSYTSILDLRGPPIPSYTPATLSTTPSAPSYASIAVLAPRTLSHIPKITREKGFNSDKDVDYAEHGKGEELVIGSQGERRLLGQTEDGLQLFRGGEKITSVPEEDDTERKKQQTARSTDRDEDKNEDEVPQDEAQVTEDEDFVSGEEEFDSDEEEFGSDEEPEVNEKKQWRTFKETTFSTPSAPSYELITSRSPSISSKMPASSMSTYSTAPTCSSIPTTTLYATDAPSYAEIVARICYSASPAASHTTGPQKDSMSGSISTVPTAEIFKIEDSQPIATPAENPDPLAITTGVLPCDSTELIADSPVGESDNESVVTNTMPVSPASPMPNLPPSPSKSPSRSPPKPVHIPGGSRKERNHVAEQVGVPSNTATYAAIAATTYRPASPTSQVTGRSHNSAILRQGVKLGILKKKQKGPQYLKPMALESNHSNWT
ncbi:hypothetical protein F4818DRAFT_453339 [Hypoxylon cercidicola]|nr:hypothetical protein F4818DRAFT_453339 [Hypoxylon cercidicola]